MPAAVDWHSQGIWLQNGIDLVVITAFGSTEILPWKPSMK